MWLHWLRGCCSLDLDVGMQDSPERGPVRFCVHDNLFAPNQQQDIDRSNHFCILPCRDLKIKSGDFVPTRRYRLNFTTSSFIFWPEVQSVKRTFSRERHLKNFKNKSSIMSRGNASKKRAAQLRFTSCLRVYFDADIGLIGSECKYLFSEALHNLKFNLRLLLGIRQLHYSHNSHVKRQEDCCFPHRRQLLATNYLVESA